MKCLPSVPAQSGSACQEGSKDGDLHGHVEFGWKNSSNSSNQLNRRSLRRYANATSFVSFVVQKFVRRVESRDVRANMRGIDLSDSFLPI
jgi:hypothetical protein